MNIDVSPEAREFGRVASGAIESAGGDRLLQTAESEPDRRDRLVVPLLEALGGWDLDVRGSADDLEAAAMLCRSAGYWSLPYPVAERLCRPTDLDVCGLSVIAGPPPSARIDGLVGSWAAVSLTGERFRVTAREPSEPPRTSAFVSNLNLGPIDRNGIGDVALAVTLPCWTLLGMLDRAIALTVAYAQERRQFGQTLARFQGVQFQLTEAEVERSGVEELARYALWSVQSSCQRALADAMALRLAAIEAADVVFRVAHQIHGAIGFCDETALSWVSRHSHPLRRLPLGHAATQAWLTDHVGTFGLSGIFDEVSR